MRVPTRAEQGQFSWKGGPISYRWPLTDVICFECANAEGAPQTGSRLEMESRRTHIPDKLPSAARGLKRLKSPPMPLPKKSVIINALKYISLNFNPFFFIPHIFLFFEKEETF